MLQRDALFIGLRPLLLIGIVGAFAESSRGDDGWLTQPERDFFSAVGTNANVDGKSIAAAPRFNEFPEIAKRAPLPLQTRIQGISEALGQLNMTEDEKKAINEVQERLKKAVKGQAQGVMLSALASGNAKGAAANAANNILRSGMVDKALELERDSIVRRLKARETVDTNLNEIMNEIERRVGKTRPVTDLSLQVEVAGNQMHITGKPSTEFGTSIVRVFLRVKPVNGGLSASVDETIKLIQSLGVNQLDPKTQELGKSLVAAQERMMNLPIVTTELLPNLTPQSTLALVFPLERSLGVESIDVKLWSGEGTLSLEKLPGLDVVQTAARKYVVEEQVKRMTPQQKAQAAKQRTKQDQLATAALKYAQSQLTAKNLEEAKAAFNRVLDLAPDSEAAKTAKAALKNFEK